MLMPAHHHSPSITRRIRQQQLHRSVYIYIPTAFLVPPLYSSAGRKGVVLSVDLHTRNRFPLIAPHLSLSPIRMYKRRTLKLTTIIFFLVPQNPPKKRLRSFYIQRGRRTFPESIETLEEIKRRVGGMSRTQRLRGYKEGKGIRIDSMMFRQHHVDRSSPPLRTSQFHERANPAENRNGSGIEKAPHSARPLVHDTVSWPFFFFFSGLFIYLSICSILLSFFLSSASFYWHHFRRPPIKRGREPIQQ